MNFYRFVPKLFLLVVMAGVAAWSQDATPAAEKPAAPAQTTAQASDQPPMPAATPGSATHVMGFENVKRNAKGKLTVDEKALKFGAASIELTAIQDILTGSESRQTGGTALMVAKMAVPYGGGRVVSLFSHEQVDNITIDYTDANGGLHSAIFMVPKSHAEGLKKQLVSRGAKTTVPVLDTAKIDAPKEKK
jgi:predicted RecA/RadA family phage recombinase